MQNQRSNVQKTSESLPIDNAILGTVYNPKHPQIEDKYAKWKVIAVDIYGRIFLETETGSVHFYDKDDFNRNFSIANCT